MSISRPVAERKGHGLCVEEGTYAKIAARNRSKACFLAACRDIGHIETVVLLLMVGRVFGRPLSRLVGGKAEWFC
jgi:hypothetical protein